MKKSPLRRLIDKEGEEEEDVYLHDEMQTIKSLMKEKLICILRYNGLDSIACLHWMLLLLLGILIHSHMNLSSFAYELNVIFFYFLGIFLYVSFDKWRYMYI